MNIEICKNCKHNWMVLKNLHCLSYVIDYGFQCNADDSFNLSKDIVLIDSWRYDIFQKYFNIVYDAKIGWYSKRNRIDIKNNVPNELHKAMEDIELKDKRCPYYAEHELYDWNKEK